jgi:beta-galactosidase
MDDKIVSVSGRSPLFCINGEILDQVIQPLGTSFFIEWIRMEGFFLNGEHLPLRGVCRHQDRSEIGNALHPEHQKRMRLLMLGKCE